VKIRRATSDDIPEILPLWRELMDMHAEMEPMFRPVEGAEEKFRVFISSTLANENFCVWVAEVEGAIAGYVIVSMSMTPEVFVIRRRLYIQDMVVALPFRRMGIARALMNEVLHFAQEKGIEKMDLLVAVRNEAANRFWESVGFKPALNYMNMYLV
jgi:diamine N-acetyltransferase